MKGKYFGAIFFVGFLPVLILAGVYGWMKFTEAPPVSAPAVQEVNYAPVSLLEGQVGSIASSLFSSIKKTVGDIPTLTSVHGDADLSNFVESHPGVQGLFVVSPTGKILKNLPATPPLADGQYASSDEFKTIQERLQAKPGQTYQFYTQRLNYPAFLFAQPLTDKSVAVAVFNLGHFFPPLDPKDTKSGVYFILDASSGRYFFHSDPSKLSETFNPGNAPWLSKVSTDLNNQQAGSSLEPGVGAVVYAPLGFGKFGVVTQVPYSTVIPPSPAAKPEPKPTLADLPQLILKWFYTPFGLAIVILWAWVWLMGSLFLSGILAPVRRASAVVLKAAQGEGSITPETLKAFGKDEVGQMVQAAAMLIQNLEQEKQKIEQEKNDSVRQMRSQMDEKARESTAMVSSAQQTAQGAKSELAEKSQVLNDKLKELDALKAMSEGLRNQTEQSKNDTALLKGQLATAERAQSDVATKLQQTEAKLKEMDAKLLNAVSAASAIQVSSVRAAAIRTMADELKTTLGIIKGYVSSALGTVQGGISEKQQEFLGMVINRSARLEKFINDLLDIYQVEIEAEDAKREDVNLGSEIEGLAFNFQAQADVKAIKLRIEPQPNLPKVPIVRRRFNQLWNILYLQIIKDAPRSSIIPIKVEAVGENVKVTVEDPGLNVKTESLPHLYDEFYDPKHTASTQLAGTGLKFALVKTILAGHGGGAVAEKSDPGTRLILTFPTKYKKPSEVAAAATAAAAAASAQAVKTPSPVAVKPVPPSPAPGPMPTGAPRPAAPGLTPAGAKPAAAGSGVLDSLLAGRVPPVAPAASLRPAAPGIPGAASAPGAPGLPPKPGAPPLGGPALGIRIPPSPAPGVPGVKPPAAAPGLLDALLDKKAPASPAGPVAGAVPPAAPKPPISLGAPGALDALLGTKPATPPVPGAPTAGAPVRPPAAPSLGAMPSAAPKPPVAPIAPPSLGAPKPPGTPMPPPGTPMTPPSMGAPRPPGLPMPPPGAPIPPKVVPTSLKPTAPPSGVFDLDNVDSVKTGDEPKPAPKPAGPPPGVPPGGLDANKPMATDLSKESDGELIE